MEVIEVLDHNDRNRTDQNNHEESREEKVESEKEVEEDRQEGAVGGEGFQDLELVKKNVTLISLQSYEEESYSVVDETEKNDEVIFFMFFL